MARPTKFNAERGRIIIEAVAKGQARKAAAEAAGVGLRTLADWLARGRASDPATDDLAEWVLWFEAAERVASRRRRNARIERERIAAAERWQRFKAARERWWMEQLGPVEFWKRRVGWLAANEKERSLGPAVARLAIALGVVRVP